MHSDCPDPKEVADFHFLQLKTVKIVEENEGIPLKSVNLLASGSKYGLFFIGIEGGFKVVQLEDVLSLEEDKETAKSSFSTFVPSGTPSALAVNASQSTLAVCVKNVSGVLIHFYSLSSFPGPVGTWHPVLSNTISAPGVHLEDFLWNPCMEGLYTFCLSDGSLHIHEFLGMSIKSVASLQTAEAISVCWSPKGKQLVAGKKNGSFTQYKQTLQEVKTVLAPQFEESPVTVRSICWISNTVFAVVYVASEMPYLFIVSAMKDSSVQYTNFNDVCLGNSSSPDQKYFLHLEPSWGILICASLDSIEIAVLGDMPNWVQWDLKEDGKALLPGKDGATHAVGMTVMYSSQRPIIVSESESYPPMPVMLLLTDNGLLVSFYMINAKAEAPTLVSPPLPLEHFASVADVSQISQPPSNTTYVAEKNPIGSLVCENSETRNMFSCADGMMKDSTFSFADKLKGNETFVNNSERLNPETQDKTSLTDTERKEAESRTENSYMLAIISEIQSFTKELQDLKQLQSSTSTLDIEEDMISLKTFALNLQKFQKDIFETMQSISSDVHVLKNVLLESFAMSEDARSRERRRNDHSYITMLKERALDPITAKRMQKITQHYQYLNIQLQEVTDKLNQDWVSIISSKKNSARSNSCISSTEAVYKTIVNNQKIIFNLKKKVDMLLKKTQEKKLINISKSGSWMKYNQRSTQEDLSKLADEFLQVKIYQEEAEPTVTKKLSSETQNLLKNFLNESSIVTVRPTAVYSPSQSRLLSNAIPAEEPSKSDPEKEKSSQLVVATTDAAACRTPEMNNSKKENACQSSQPYVPIYEPITPPDAVSKSNGFSPSPLRSTLLGNIEIRGIHQSVPAVPVSGSSPIKQNNSADQECNSSVTGIQQFLQSTFLSPGANLSEASPVATCTVPSQFFPNTSTLMPSQESMSSFTAVSSPSLNFERTNTTWSIPPAITKPDHAFAAETPLILRPETCAPSSSENPTLTTITPAVPTSLFATPTSKCHIPDAKENSNSQTLSFSGGDQFPLSGGGDKVLPIKVKPTSDYLDDKNNNSKLYGTPELSFNVEKSILNSSKECFVQENITSATTNEPNFNNNIQPLNQLVTKPSPVPAASTASEPTDNAKVSAVSHPDPVKVSTPETTSISAFENVTICSPISLETGKRTESSSNEIKSPLFGKAAALGTTSPSFPQETTSFGQSSTFPPATSEGVFSQESNLGTLTATVSSSDVNDQASAFSFGKPAFGQATGSFGLAKSFFGGQNTTPFTQSGTSSFSFAQNSNPVFGQGSFFSGLGGKPSEENASRNVFGVSNAVKSGDTSNLFKNSFGAVDNSSFSAGGSFSSGGGSVAQSGFGAFQQTGGFGTTPAFGGAPAFGGGPAFGASPTFGSGSPLSSVFGQQQVSSNFSNFANASSPTFGSLASQGPGFSSPSASSTFGSQGFGISSFTNQSPSFGSPGSPPSNSSAFTQWRN